MTDLAALRALHDAIKAGGYPDRRTEVSAFYRGGSIAACNEHAGLARQANGGSLDAAHALQKAVLPGTRWDMFWLEGAVYGCNLPHQDTEYADTPARAWLLAILAALIAQQEGE